MEEDKEKKESISSISNQSDFDLSSFFSIVNSDNQPDIEKSLSSFLNIISLDQQISIISSSSFSLYNLFTKKIILSNAKICTLFPELIKKISEIKNENNIFLFFNKGCGGCLLTVLFLIVAYNPSLEEKIYNFIIDYLGDKNGCLLEKRSFSACCLKTKDELKDEYKKKKKKKDKENKEEKEEEEFCERIKDGEWKNYIQAMGVLFSHEGFIEKVKKDSMEVNNFVEEFIKKNNSFNKSNAKILLEELMIMGDK